MNYIGRQNIIVAHLKKESIDAFLVRKKENISYLTGARGENSILFVSPRKNILITDSRYEEEYKKSAIKCSVRVTKAKGLGQVITEVCAETNSRSIGFEADHFTYQGYLGLKKLPGNKKLVPLTRTVEDIRIIKDDSEIRDIRQAGSSA